MKSVSSSIVVLAAAVILSGALISNDNRDLQLGGLIAFFLGAIGLVAWSRSWKEKP